MNARSHQILHSLQTKMQSSGSTENRRHSRRISNDAQTHISATAGPWFVLHHPVLDDIINCRKASKRMSRVSYRRI